MTKTAFLAVEAQYIASIAATAGVDSTDVLVLNIVEISTISLRMMARRSLLSTSVSVETAVQVPYGQQAYLQDQSLLNSNLNKNGLPSGTLGVNSSTPSPATTAPAYSPAAASSAVPIGAIIGGVAGLVGLSGLLAAVYQRQRLARICGYDKVLY